MSLEVLKGVVSQFDSGSYRGTVSANDRRFHFDRSCVKRSVEIRQGASVTILVSRDNLLEVRAALATPIDRKKLR